MTNQQALWRSVEAANWPRSTSRWSTTCANDGKSGSAAGSWPNRSRGSCHLGAANYSFLGRINQPERTAGMITNWMESWIAKMAAGPFATMVPPILVAIGLKYSDAILPPADTAAAGIVAAVAVPQVTTATADSAANVP